MFHFDKLRKQPESNFESESGAFGASAGGASEDVSADKEPELDFSDLARTFFGELSPRTLNFDVDSNEIETADSPIASEIDKSRKELLDLGLRNPLISYRTLRQRGVEVVDADPVAVFDALVSNARRMSFAPLEEEEAHAQELIKSGDARPSRSKRFVLQTPEPPDQLKKRLRNTFYFANTTIQEQGVNTLFIALGMVEWFDPKRS